MKNYEILLSIAGMVSIIFAITEAAQLFVARGKTAQADGVIISVRTRMPETVKRNNSKWAYLTYQVKGKYYTSNTSLQVSMYAQIGDHMKVTYYINDPVKIFKHSFRRFGIALFVLTVCLLLIAVY